MMPKNPSRPTRAVALALAISTTLLACETLTEAICPTEPITIGVNATNAVTPDAGAVSSRSVNRPGGTLPSILRVQSVVVLPGDLQFTGTGTGTVAVAVVVDGYVATLGSATIVGGAVTSVNPTTQVPGQYSRADARAMIGSLTDAERASLNLRNLDDLTDAQIADAVSAAVRRPEFDLALITRSVGDVQGTLTLQRVTFNVTC
jgi:hypothetical protein